MERLTLPVQVAVQSGGATGSHSNGLSGVSVLMHLDARRGRRPSQGSHRTTDKVTSMLPRVALEYGHTSWAFSVSASAVS